MRRLAIERTTQDILEFKRIRLQSEMRNPPMDERGWLRFILRDGLVTSYYRTGHKVTDVTCVSLFPNFQVFSWSFPVKEEGFLP